MQNTKKLLFTAILAVAALVTNNSHCAAGGGHKGWIKTLDGESHTIFFDNATTVATLKRQIQENYGFPVEQQRIIFAGRLLNDTDTMRGMPQENLIGLTLSLVPQEPEQQQQVQPIRITPPAPRCVAPQAAVPGRRYQIGDVVSVIVKGERKIGRIKGFMADTGLYTVDTGDKDRSFMENDMNPA